MSRNICAECIKWKPGDFWESGDDKHKTLVACQGLCCRFKRTKKCWNYRLACRYFESNPNLENHIMIHVNVFPTLDKVPITINLN